MMLWLILALMTAGALGAVVWPLVRARGMTAAGSDLVVYRDQLEEIERDRTDRRIGADEAGPPVSKCRAGASRRMPRRRGRAADRRPAPLCRRGGCRDHNPAARVAFYGVYGSPDLPGQPLAARTPAAEENLENNRSPSCSPAWRLISKKTRMMGGAGRWWRRST
jgi:cytochrome c-type biogenesis protein CcmH